MLDYSVFDNLLDAVFFVDKDKKIFYCNEIAASICGSSVKRLSKGTPFYQIMEFENGDIYLNENGTLGQDEPLDYVEVRFKVHKDENLKGRVQMRIDHFEVNGERVSQVIMHDVTLEEQLHSKYHAQLEEKEDLIKLLEEAKDELEEYNKNLEAMIAERTKELSKANNMLSAMMDSLGQGFVIIDSDGMCGDIYTRSCETILESKPAGQKIWETLSVPSNEVDQVKMWIQAVFSEALPFDSLQELGPKIYDHSQGKYVTLAFFPIRDENNTIQFLVMVATDKTLEYTAKKEMDRQKNHIQMILKIIRNRAQFASFVSELPEKIKAIEALVEKSSVPDFDELLRQLHTLEGETGVFNLDQIAAEAKNCQQEINNIALDPPQKGPFPSLIEGIKCMRQTYEQFMKSNDDIFTTLGVFGSESIEVDVDVAQEFLTELKQKGVPQDLVKSFERAFLLKPFKSHLTHYNDLVQLIADKQCKFVDPIDFKGGNIKVNVSGLEQVFDSFVHIFRNIVDHGIEVPEVREEKNKPSHGKIVVYSHLDGSSNNSTLILEVSDDGAGIDVERIRKKLSLLHPDEDFTKMSEEEVLYHIFAPGFSSRSEVGEFSGRGVGMDALKTEVEKVGGNISVQSQVGKGTQFIIELPLQDLNSEKRAA